MIEESLNKTVTLTKEPGKKWIVDFSGRITRRELNHLRRLLPVEYARLGRRRQMKRLAVERIQREELAAMTAAAEKAKEALTVEKKRPTKVSSVHQAAANVTTKEISDGTV